VFGNFVITLIDMQLNYMEIFFKQSLNSIFMKKKNLKNNEDNIFITEDLTKVRQSIIKELSTHKKAQSFLGES
jgi:hypothetical protein